MIKIYVLIAQKNVEIVNNFFVANALLISRKLSVFLVINVFVIIASPMYFYAKTVKIMFAKIVLVNALNVTQFYAKMKILV